jgi:hypothetical protein
MPISILIVLCLLYIISCTSKIVAKTKWVASYLGILTLFTTHKVSNYETVLSIKARPSPYKTSYRIDLLVRQNDPTFNLAIKHFFGFRDNLFVNLYDIMSIPIEILYDERRAKLRTFLTNAYRKIKALVTSCSAIEVTVRRKTNRRSFTATYTIKYIYNNGGFINHVETI